MELAPRLGGIMSRLQLPVCALRTWALVFWLLFTAPTLAAFACAWWWSRDGASAAALQACLAVAGAVCIGALLVAHLLARAIDGLGRTDRPAPAGSHPVREVGDLARRCAALTQALRTLNATRLDAEEAERRRLARELHDEVGQELALLHIWLQTLQKDRLDLANCTRVLQEIESLAGTIMEQVRSMALDLRPAQLDDLGLSAALRSLARRVGHRTGISVKLKAPPEQGQRLPDTVETALFRIAQAAVTNAVRHAQASTVWVALEVRESEATLKVQDDGVGFDQDVLQANAVANSGMGIVVMQERVRALGGAMDIITAPGTGTLVRATIPVVSTCAA